jgi:CRP/FNR family transcriptional regulator, anaerobic regulatory protein
MLHEDIARQIRQHFTVLAQSGDIAQAIATESQALSLPEGKVLLDTGDTINYIPLVIDGIIKVVRSDAEGHEILMYYIHPGESCALTLSASLKREKSKIKAVVQQKATIVLLPTTVNWQLARRYPVWFDFVLDAYGKRFEELLELVEEVGFKHLDERLEKYLRHQFAFHSGTVIAISHQEIASALGTARVVVSRMLKQLEKKGQIRLMRGKIKNIGLV